MEEVKRLAESLGALLSTDPSDEQKKTFDLYINYAKNNQFLEKVINYPIQRYNGRTLVHIAADKGLPDYLEVLLANGGNPNKQSTSPDLCQTPLHLAAFQGYARCIQILVRHGAQIRIENTHRVTPVDLARGKVNCEKVFMHAIAKVEEPARNQEQLQRVMELHKFLDDGTDLETFVNVYTTLAPMEKDLGTRWTDWFQQTLLYRAIDKQCVPVVDFLLKQSSHQPLSNLGNGDTPLIAACRHGNVKLADLLLRHSPQLVFVCDEQNRLSPLHVSCSRGDKGMVQQILDAVQYLYEEHNYKQDLNQTDKIGRTPLFNACYHGQLEVVKDLLEFRRKHPDKIDLNAETETRRTPLHAAIAALKFSKDIVELLLCECELNINVEGKPSSRAQKFLQKVIERKRPLTATLSPQDSKRSLEEEHEDRIVSPPLSDTPISFNSYISDDLDAEMGITKVFDTESTVTPLTPRTSTFPHSTHNRPFIQSLLIHPVSPTAVGTGVYQSPKGLLEVLDKKPPNYIPFSDILITPLAEACIFRNKEIIEMLISHGAMDKKGLACQILDLVQKPNFIHLILSKQCELKLDTFDNDQYNELCDTPSVSLYQLQWNEKHLRAIDGKWLTPTSSFYSFDLGPMLEMGSLMCQPITFTRVDYTGIVSVSLQKNNLVTVPLELFNLPNVQTINVSHNELQYLPDKSDIDFRNLSSEASETTDGLWKCHGLLFLSLSHNKLTYLPSCLWLLPSLQKLNADYNNLKSLINSKDPSVSKDIGPCPALTEINLSHNKLEGLHNFLFCLPNVAKLNLSHNLLISLPSTTWQCESIQELDVSNNELTALPHCEGDELREGNLTIRSVGAPDVFMMASPLDNTRATLQGDLDRQFSLYSHNSRHRSLTKTKEKFRIRRVDDKLEQELPDASVDIEACDYSTLTRLNLSNNRFSLFPQGLPCLAPNLMELDISNNLIQSIDIHFIPQSLRKLIAKQCKLERFGNTLTDDQLKNIRRKCYHDNTTNVCVHRSHSSLQYLQTAQLPGNHFKRFQLIKCSLKRTTQDPTIDEIAFRQKCSALDLLYPSLEGLDLTQNYLEGTFNPNIGRQSQLKWIRLSRNPQLEKLPLQFALLKNSRRLTEIRIDNSPNLIEPPPEYHDAKIQAGQLLTYMRSKLKESVPYRTMKLFLIGCGRRGKTTLLRRLRERQAGETERTEGIDIEEWACRGGKVRFVFRANRQPVQFLAWDFAGQEVYQVTHQCFYSRRALYLAVFRLSDGDDGVNELEPWLRNVQLRAPGCIVIVVGTHLDQVSETESMRLEKLVEEKYHGKIYPKVVGCISISCVNTFNFKSNNVDRLRQLIYHISVHLHVSPADGVTLEYKKDLDESSPYALLQQQIPKSFLTLQEKVSELVKDLQDKGKPPVLQSTEFKQHFQKLFDDEEELNEAVHYLTLQGTLLHFNDYNLRSLYFLDPQWLAKLMAKLISPSAAENVKMVQGRIQISDLFKDDMFLQQDKLLTDNYLQLLQKFEVALYISKEEVIIPSLMQEEGKYPKLNDSLNGVDLSFGHDDCYIPPLRRLWLSNYIPDGFWPRLICRVIKDQQIKSILSYYVEQAEHQVLLDWNCWRNGIVFTSRGRTLLIVHCLPNPSNEWPGPDNKSIKSLSEKYRIETHIYIPDMINVITELVDQKQEIDSEEIPTPYTVAGHATRLMVAISNHIIFLSRWFYGMLTEHTLNGYIPCWKGYGNIAGDGILRYPKKTAFIDVDGRPVFCLLFNDCVTPACSGSDFECIAHGTLKTVHAAPDLAFWDLVTSNQEMEKPRLLRIMENDLLGKGGFGFVCKGELIGEPGTKHEQVAVKVYLSNMESKMESSSPSELLSIARQDSQLSAAYKEIRQEVTFLAGLNHKNITQLKGVRTDPVLCLLLELAPKKALRSILKDYSSRKVSLEPLTLKQSAKQIADGLNYLHSQQIVHLDMKSPNVLVWEFPSPLLPRQERIEQAGNVWLKIADYGISQVSTSLMMKITTNPVGTPGYMAPELFESPGQEIFSTKVDVFAYGMTLYELISLQAPFQKLEAQKRNHEVRDGKRPPIGSKDKHTPLLIQDLMRLCWNQDPSVRPSMKQCHQWASSVEFERLRTQITLGSCSAISSACVSRVEPEYEDEWIAKDSSSVPASLPVDMNGTLLTQEDVKRFSIDVDIIPPEKESLEIEESFVNISVEEDSESVRDENQPDLPDTSETDQTDNEIEQLKSSLDVVNEDVPPAIKRVKVTSSSIHETKSITAALLQTQHEQNKQQQAYTQVWMCGRDQKKGLLSVFIFPDNHKSVYVSYKPRLILRITRTLRFENESRFRFFGYVGKDEIQALCPVRNAIWIGTSLGHLRIIHAPTLEVKYSGKLILGKSQTSAVLKILHVKEEECVLASLTSSEIWSLYDRLVGTPLSLMKQQCISTADNDGSGPVYDLVKVVVDGQIQVWGTMDNNALLLLERKDGEWTKSYYSIQPYSHHMKVCSHIVWCSFEDDVGGEKQDHLWISYRSKGGIMCFDVRSRKQRGSINCTEKLKSLLDIDQTQQVTSLLAQGRRLYVGTLSGIVAIFDSMSFGLISQFSWHEGKVRSLLLLPEQIKACVCAEVPIVGSKDRVLSNQLKRCLSVSSSRVTNPCFVPNVGTELSLVASIGNGRLKLLTKEEKEEANMQPSRRFTWMPHAHEDITLLMWHS